MAGLKKTYRVVDDNGRIYLPKSVRGKAGIHPGGIIRLEVDSGGWIGLMKVELIGAGGQSPKIMEVYVCVTAHQVSGKSRMSLLAELAELI